MVSVIKLCYIDWGNDGYLDAEEIKNMDISVIETASRLGYDTSLYRPLSESKKKMILV